MRWHNNNTSFCVKKKSCREFYCITLRRVETRWGKSQIHAQMNEQKKSFEKATKQLKIHGEGICVQKAST